MLSLTSLSQAEIAGGEMEPFTIEMEALAARKADRTTVKPNIIGLILFICSGFSKKNGETHISPQI